MKGNWIIYDKFTILKIQLNLRSFFFLKGMCVLCPVLISYFIKLLSNTLHILFNFKVINKRKYKISSNKRENIKSIDNIKIIFK